MVESTKGYDATDNNDHHYEIKGRRSPAENQSRQLSMIRELEKNHFDFLVSIVFQENFIVLKGCVVPHDVVLKRAKYHKRPNACIFHLKDDNWRISVVRDIAKELKCLDLYLTLQALSK
ncbi:MAG: hypothetical protein CSYNP_03657 [Syntrophus sp. SKADARSKE-3]|nr:hypothetical protein [Syntrophus sp. SKADARSKE-3]